MSPRTVLETSISKLGERGDKELVKRSDAKSSEMAVSELSPEVSRL